MKKSDIQQKIVSNILDPLRKMGCTVVTLQAGNIEASLGLRQRTAAVCKAMEDLPQFCNWILLLQKWIPPTIRNAKGYGTRAWFTYRINTSGQNSVQYFDVYFPCLSSSGIWWQGVKDYLEEQLKIIGKRTIRLVIKAGGKIPIPEWFKQWCDANGIKIEFVEFIDETN